MFITAGTILIILGLAHFYWFGDSSEQAIIINLVIFIMGAACLFLHNYFSEFRHKVKITRAKVLKKHTISAPGSIWGQYITFQFPDNKKRKLAVPREYANSIEVGDTVDVKHKGTGVHSVKNIVVSTTRAKVMKKHTVATMLAELGRYTIVSFLFSDKNTYEMIVPWKYSKPLRIGDIVTLTHRGNLVESIKKEAIVKPKSTSVNSQNKSIPQRNR